jgi:hypothetical protein
MPYFNFSKRLHFATLCCFLLPFFYYTGCGPSAAEKEAQAAAQAQVIHDSLAAVEAAEQEANDTKIINSNSVLPNNAAISTVDTIRESNSAQTDTSKEQTKELQETTNTDKPDKKNESSSEQIAKEYPLLQPLLIPKTDVHTGLAAVIDVFPFLMANGVFNALLLLIISLTIKHIEPEARKSIALLNVLALLSLCFSMPYTFFMKNYGAMAYVYHLFLS